MKLTPEELVRWLRSSSTEVRQSFERTLPQLVGAAAVDHFKKSFRDEGFTDATLEPWKDVKRRTNPTRADRAAASLPILTQSGDLGRSIEFTTQPGEAVITADTRGAGSDKDYAAQHNEGTRLIPKRQFIGPSQTLDRRVERISIRLIRRMLNP